MSDHYTLEAFDESYAVFGSRWGECLVVDRATRASYYAHNDQSGAECDALASLEEDVVFDLVCAAKIGDARNEETLPPSIVTCLDALSRVDGKTRGQIT